LDFGQFVGIESFIILSYNKLVKLVHTPEFLNAKDVVIQGHDYFVALEPISFIESLKNNFKKVLSV